MGLRNGTLWHDVEGRPIQAHGGWILPVYDERPAGGAVCGRDAGAAGGAVWGRDAGAAGGPTYYWYGEDKSGITVGRRMDAIGIRCYRSRDLVAWEDCGLVFRANADSELDVLRPSGVMERPRVLRCPSTGRYVMWLHSDDAHYRYAGVTVAVADAPEGPFEWVRTMIPNRQDSRDFTLFEDAWAPDGTPLPPGERTAYLIHSSEWNKTLHVARLTPDYLDVDGSWSRAFPDQEREAPCVMRLSAQPEERFAGGYAMLTSGCTGWAPNAALFGTSAQMVGPWKLVDNPCRGEGARTTFDGQATCVFMVPSEGIASGGVIEGTPETDGVAGAVPGAGTVDGVTGLAAATDGAAGCAVGVVPGAGTAGTTGMAGGAAATSPVDAAIGPDGPARAFVLIDHWHPDDLGSSGYSILPAQVTRAHHPALRIVWEDEWQGIG